MIARHGRGKRVSALWAYEIQACFLSWFAWLPALLLGARDGYTAFVGTGAPGVLGAEFANSAHRLVALLAIVAWYGPLLAAWGIAYRLGGQQGVSTLLRRIVHWRLPARWYGIVLALGVLMPVPAVLVALLAGVVSADARLPLTGWQMLSLLLFNLFTMAMQEPGWRGVAQPLAQRRYTAEQSSYIVGLLWALWMLPYLLLLSQGQALGPAWPLHLIGWAVFLVGNAVILAWLYNSTSSLWLCMVYHAVVMTAQAVAIGLTGPHPLAPLVLGLTAWGVGVLIQRRNGVTALATQRVSGRR